jgi:acyl dehydratase
MSIIREKAISGLNPGDRFVTTRTFTEADMRRFAEISRDYNPVHFDRRFAEAKNFKGRICHGLLVAGLLTEIGGQLGWLASGINLKFRKPVYFGDTVECCLTIREMDERGRTAAEIIFRNQEEEIVLEAHLTGIVPGYEEQQIMRAMTDEGDPTNPLR